MTNKMFLTAAAALALAIGFNATASAQTDEQKRAAAQREIDRAMAAVKDAQAVGLAKFKADLAKEQPYTQNGATSGPYLFTAYNKTDFDVWVTFYAKQWYGDKSTGQACIPPGKSAGIASSDWGTLKASIQVEVKQGLKCGGGNNGQANLLTEGATVVKGGTSRVTITNNSSPVASFVQ